MSAKIQKKFAVDAKGELHIDTDTATLTVTNTETGEAFDLADLLSDFNGREVKISCNYAEDIG